MDFPASVQYLYSLGNEVKTIKLGLERVLRLLRELGDPHLAVPVIHVAGTNGKGSVSAMVEAGLRAAGKRTGLYTSPHLVSPTERIQVYGKAVSEEEFAAAFAVIHDVSARLVAEGELDAHPTYFETVTAMAFWTFAGAKLDYAVVEVGLGGRLDATNVVNPVLTVITPVDMDHQQYLGDTLQKIAREKAGIQKAGVPLVLAPQHEEIRHVFAEGEIEDVARWELSGLELTPRGCRYEARCGTEAIAVKCPLPGRHQVTNSLTAALALRRLGVEHEGIAGARWPGRLEVVREKPLVYLDGAHNPAAAAMLRDFILSHFEGREVWMVFGVMRDKAVSGITEQLFPLVDRLILTRAAQQRGLEPEAILEFTPHSRATVTQSVAEAVEMLGEAPEDAVIFLTGSLFVVGEARPLLQ
jgi:dihydrofolate synthase / folylpolyglutamate synthase